MKTFKWASFGTLGCVLFAVSFLYSAQPAADVIRAACKGPAVKICIFPVPDPGGDGPPAIA